MPSRNYKANSFSSLIKVGIACLIAFNINGFASSCIKTATSFNSVSKIIQKIKDPTTTLVAFDDDDTLTMMPCISKNDCQYIGGPAWFSWQNALDNNDPKRVSPTFSGLLHTSSLLLSLSDMPVTDPNELSDLQQLTQANYHIMVETARGPNLMDSTENQLVDDHLLSIITPASPSNELGNHSIAGTFIPEGASRPIRYANGVYYLSGQNKGLMLIALLAKLNQTNRYQNIVLVDDTMKNITDFADAFKSNNSIHATAIYYKNLEKHKHDFTASTKLQDISIQRWHKIKASLQSNLPSFND